jgi:tetratricopeptide (TPR) repeat protein
LDPINQHYRSELGQSHANLADAQLNACDLEGALQSRTEALELETSLLQDDSENPNTKLRLVDALTGYAHIQASRGFNDEAIVRYIKAVELIESIEAIGSDSGITGRDDLVDRRQRIVWLEAMNGNIDEAWAGSSALTDDWEHLVATVGLDSVPTLVIYLNFLLDRSWLANQRGDSVLAGNLLEEVMALLIPRLEGLPDNRDLGNTLALAAYRYWEIRHELPTYELLSLIPDYSAFIGRTRACEDASRAVSLAVMLGEPARADKLVPYLLDSGYRETGFMRICKANFSCSGQD